MAENVQISLGIKSDSSQAQQDVSSLTRAFQHLQEVASSLGKGGNIAEYGRQIRAVTNEIAHMKGRADIAKTMEAFNQTPNIENLSRFANAVSSEYNRAAKEIKSANNEMGSSTQKTNSIFSNFFGSLTRIAKLRLLRGIIRMVTQAFKEGTENIYQYSIAMGNADASHFSATMNSLASSFLYLKNSIGSVVAPLLSSLVPAIQTVIGWVTAALNVLAQFFAVLNGQSTYTRAKQAATEWKAVGAAAGGAAAAAKEYENTILGFDELHVLNDPSQGGGGGGGGGAGTPDYSSMFEEAELATSGIAGAFNRLATAVKPILRDLWHFAENTIETIFDGFAIACDLAVAVFSGDMDAIKKALDDLGVFISKHKALKWIVQATADASGWVLHAIDDVKLAVLSAIEWFINLPLVKGALEAIGIDVDKLTGRIDAQKSEINKHKDAVSDNIKVYKMWADGVEINTAKATVAIARQSANSIKEFAGITTSVNNANGSIGEYRSAVEKADAQKPTFANVIRGFDNTAGSAWNAYSNAVTFANTIDKLRLLDGTEVHFSMAGVVHGGGGFSWANGGYVTGYAKGGMIPSYASGGVNSADLFMANESGNPELVGRIGSRTAVANQGQMVEALASGIYRAMTDAQSGSSSNVEVVVQMDGVAVARANDRGQKALNRRFNVQLA